MAHRLGRVRARRRCSSRVECVRHATQAWERRSPRRSCTNSRSPAIDALPGGIKVCTAVRRGHGGGVCQRRLLDVLQGYGRTVRRSFWERFHHVLGGQRRLGARRRPRPKVRAERSVPSLGLSMAAAIGLLAAAPGVLLWAYASAALFGSTYIMLTGIILVWSVWVFHERPSAGLGAAFLLIAVGQVFGALTAGALAGAAGLVVTFWAFAAIAVVTALISPRAEHPTPA